MAVEEFEVLRMWIQKLALDCPMKDAMPGCPLSAVRELPVNERLAVVDGMGVEELQRIMQHHSICLGTRH